MSSKVSKAVSQLKKNNINVTNRENHVIALLKPITLDSLMGIEALANEMTIWRNKAMPFFKTGFVATTERTINWLKNSVIPAENKILYLIYVDETLIGHFGLCNITEESAELDNAIRGEKGGSSDLFDCIENAILKTAFETLKVKSVYGRLFSNNFMAMSLHKRLGFIENQRSPLKLVKRQSEWEYVECLPEEHNVRFQYVELILTNTRFKLLN